MTASIDILSILEANAEGIRSRYGIRRLGVFGSVARLEAGDASDVDILVDFAKPTFDSYMDLKFELEDTLGRSVDLVIEETLKPALRDKVLAEARYVA